MNDQNQTPQDDELEGFDTFEDEAPIDDPMAGEEPIDDADFQDISDDVDADVFGEGAPAPAPKKKTSWFNIGIAVVAVVVAGGLIFMKLGPSLMGGGDEAPMSAPAADNGTGGAPAVGQPAPGQVKAQAAAQAALAPDGKSKAAAAKSPGLLDQPDQYANLGNGSIQPTPAPVAVPAVAGSDPFAGVPNKPTDIPTAGVPAGQVPMPAPISGSPMPTTAGPAGSGMPAPTLVGDTGNANTNKTPVVIPPAATATPIAVAAATGGDNSALETKVNNLENRLNDMDSKLTAIQQAPAADDSRLNTIQTTLERLESRLNDMASSGRHVTREASAPVVSVPNNDGGPVEVAAKHVVRKAAKVKKAVTNQWNSTYNRHPTPVSTGSGGWQLRGATPGRATLARGSDIREVGVGESLPGLGQITGVAMINGQWVVQGTQGRLAQ